MFLDTFVYWLYNAILLFSVYLIVAKRSFIIKHKKEIFVFLITILLYSQYRRYGARLFTPTFEYTIETLPIHFCRFSAVMTLLYLITKNKIIKGFVYFQAGLGIFSVLIPGGFFFTMSYEWRSFTYIVDHMILAIMPFFLIFIEDYKVNRRDLIISIAYTVIVPLAVLPWALATDYNAYYVLDGVFLRDIVGDNQVLIMVYMLLVLVLYNLLMYVVGEALQNWSEKRYKNEDNLFAPTYPWYIMAGFVLLGLVISFFYIRPTPGYLTVDAASYLERPVQVFGEDLVVYAGTGENNELYYFFEALDEDIEVEVYNLDTDQLQTFLADDLHTVYIDSTNINDEGIMILLVTVDEDQNRSVEIFTMDVMIDYNQFMEEYQNNLTMN
jgi:uncharacterized membrane protein YwaF